MNKNLLVSCGTVFLLIGSMWGDSRAVGCPGGSPGQYSSIAAALASLDPHGPNTITISGACKENVTIQSFDRLTLNGQGSASVNDNSGGTAGVIVIGDAQRISIQGLTISGGRFGVACWDHSLCRFSGNTIQGALGPGVNVTGGSDARFNGDVIQDNGGGAVNLFTASNVIMRGVTIRRNRGFAAIFARLQSYVDLAQTTIQNNQGHGVLLGNYSVLKVVGSTITNNQGDGIKAQFNSAVQVGESGNPTQTNVISQNGGTGVELAYLSSTDFISGQVVTGNMSGSDVVCNPPFSAARGAHTNIGGGVTTCEDPETPAQDSEGDEPEQMGYKGEN